MNQLGTWLGAVLVTVCVWALGAPKVHADERTDARREFRTGMQMVADGKYDEGIEHLEKAYDILPHPNVLYNIGLAHTYAGRVDAALYYFERYKETAPTADAVEVDALIARLKSAAAGATEPAVAEQTEEAEEQARDELALVVAAADDMRKAADASGDAALRKRAEELEAAAKRLREQQAAAPTAEATAPSTEKPGAVPVAGLPASQPQKAEVGKATDAEIYEEQVVSASRLAQSPLDAPNATAIITAQDIRLTGLTNLNDLLRRIAGVEVNSVTPNHAEVGIRGLNRRTSNKVLLLVDGRSLRQDFLGSAWYDFLPISLEDVERIEIIRGPASALYGADAFSGIVNIITRVPGEGGNFVSGGFGNHNGARAVASFNGKEGDLTYHFGFGYDQEDVSVKMLNERRVDIVSLTSTPNVASAKMWANAEMRYPIAKTSLLTIGGNVVSGDQVVQGLGRLLQVSVDDATATQIYTTLTTPIGVRVASWWNHMDARAGLTTQTPDGVDLPADTGVFDVADVDLSYSGRFVLGVPQTITVGGGYRFKNVAFTWLDREHSQHHYGAYVQDVIELTSALRLQLGARVDRHPLLSALQFSPRGSVVYRFLEDQSLRASVGRAFRGPSFLESYLVFPVATPVRGVLGYGVGDQNLDPESITSYEIGYQNQAFDFFAFELNAYFNRVKDFMYLSDFQRYTLSDFADKNEQDLSSYDGTWGAFPISSLGVQNQRAAFRQLGGEAGVRLFPITGLDFYANYSLHNTQPENKKQVSAALGKEQQTSLHKLNTGVQYRSQFGLDTSLDIHWFSDQVWVEQVTDVVQGVRDQTFAQPAFFLLNGRVGYRLLGDRLEVGLAGTNLTFNHKRQHPFGQPMDTRVMGMAKIRL